MSKSGVGSGSSGLRKTLLIGGRSIAAAEYFPVRNPSDRNDVIGEVACARAENVYDAIAAGRTALHGWRRLSIIERARILQNVGRAVEEQSAELAGAISREIGKLPREALGEVRKVQDFFSYYGGFGRLPVGTVLAHERGGSEVTVRREPLGVVALITPWNDPLLTVARKLCPALVSGNTVLLKPAPEASLAALLLGEICREAGLPAGVLNVVTGPDDELGKAVVNAQGLDAISFTGSAEVGLEIQQVTAGRNIPVQVEMGGKNTAVVLPDADREVAVAAIMDGAFAQAGQRCTATSRLLVHSGCYEEVMEKLHDRVRKVSVGPVTLAKSEVGPVITMQRRDWLVDQVSEVSDGTSAVVWGGTALEDGPCASGNFISPALVRDTPVESSVWRQELFGPVLAVRPFGELDEAISLVNDTPYGLSAGLFTSDIGAIAQFSSEVDAGCVAVNLPTAGWDVHVPFGGFKMSGSGGKEQGMSGIGFYTREKTLAVRADVRGHSMSSTPEEQGRVR